MTDKCLFKVIENNTLEKRVIKYHKLSPDYTKCKSCDGLNKSCEFYSKDIIQNEKNKNGKQD
jgi:hypothetical protein